MATVTLALGSNLNHPHRQLQKARTFLAQLSEQPLNASSIYLSEPVGPSEFDFLNAVLQIHTELSPDALFKQLKQQEQAQGRPSRYPKWSARTLDIDIIAYDDLVLETDTLIIPHAAYTSRLFVLLPLQDVQPDWKDPKTGHSLPFMIEHAEPLIITKTKLNW